jgi:hypothetical protein
MKAYAILALVMIAGCWEGEKGSGKAKSEVRTVGAFSAIELTGTVEAEIEIAAEPRVEVRGDDNLVAMVETKVTGDVLAIMTRQKVRPDLPLVIHIAVPSLTAIKARGATMVTAHGLRDDALSLTADGASVINADGKVHELVVEATGSGTLDLHKLTTERVRVTASGAGTVALDVTQALDARISDAGVVSYNGNPTDVTQDVRNAGKLVKH